MSTMALRNVCKSFGAVEVIRDVSLEVPDGELLILVGPSGCGKSTLLRMIAGLEDVTSGDVAIDNQRITHVPPKDRDIAMVFQNYALYPHMTVMQNMGYSLKMAGRPRRRSRRPCARPRIARAGPVPVALPKGAFRRSAPARRHRASHRAQSQGLSVR